MTYPTLSELRRGLELDGTPLGDHRSMNYSNGLYYATFPARSTQRCTASRAAIAEDPLAIAPRIDAALLSFQLRRYESAKRLFAEAVELAPTYDVLIGLAIAQRGLGDLDDAEASYTRACDLNPRRGDAYYDLAILYKTFGRPLRAIRIRSRRYVDREICTNTRASCSGSTWNVRSVGPNRRSSFDRGLRQGDSRRSMPSTSADSEDVKLCAFKSNETASPDESKPSGHLRLRMPHRRRRPTATRRCCTSPRSCSRSELATSKPCERPARGYGQLHSYELAMTSVGSQVGCSRNLGCHCRIARDPSTRRTGLRSRARQVVIGA